MDAANLNLFCHPPKAKATTLYLSYGAGAAEAEELASPNFIFHVMPSCRHNTMDSVTEIPIMWKNALFALQIW